MPNHDARVTPAPAAHAFGPALFVLLLQLAGLLAFWALANAHWPGEASRCLKDFVCYCERTEPGLVRQPFNTWSNLLCFPLALVIAAAADDERQRRLALGFALALTAQGLASMFFHGSLTRWGAVLDGVTIFFVVGLVLGVNLLRLGRLEPQQLPAWLAGCVGVALLYRWFVPVMAPLFLVSLALVLLSERRARALSLRQGPWFGRALGLMSVAIATYVLSLLPGFPLCSALFPWGHALWHGLMALVTFALWLHARDVVPQRSASGTTSLLPE